MRIGRGLEQIDPVRRQFAVDQRDDEALPGGNADLGGKSEGDLRCLVLGSRGLDRGGRNRWRGSRGRRRCGQSGQLLPHGRLGGRSGGGRRVLRSRLIGGQRTGVRRRQHAIAGFDRDDGPRHVVALVERLAEGHGAAREQRQLDVVPALAAEILQDRPALQPRRARSRVGRQAEPISRLPQRHGDDIPDANRALAGAVRGDG